MSKANVFIFAPIKGSEKSYPAFEAAGCALTYGDDDWHDPTKDYEDTIADMAKNQHAMTGTSIRSNPISRKVLEGATDLRIVAKYTIGTDDIDVDAATDLGIMVTHSPTESNWGGVAEGTMAAMLSLLKKLRERDRQVKNGGWRDTSLYGTYLGRRQDGYEGITVGIVGLGRIGSRLCDLLAPWRVRILACDPHVDRAKFVHHNAQSVDLDTLLAESDVVTMHTTLNPTTRKMMNAETFSKMKPGAIFLNMSRGKVVDEDALYDALTKGPIAAAALDVFDDEPPDRQSPLLGLEDKVLLSPHNVSFNHHSGLLPGVDWSEESILMALRGEVPDNVYNLDVIPRWMERFGGKSLI